MPRTTITLSRADLNDICDLLNLDGDASVRTEYSGRGMYGRTCIGFVVEPSEVLSVCVAVAAVMARRASSAADDIDDLLDKVDDALDLAVELARNASVDNMGLGAIVYFPGLAFSGT